MLKLINFLNTVVPASVEQIFENKTTTTNILENQVKFVQNPTSSTRLKGAFFPNIQFFNDITDTNRDFKYKDALYFNGLSFEEIEKCKIVDNRELMMGFNIGFKIIGEYKKVVLDIGDAHLNIDITSIIRKNDNFYIFANSENNFGHPSILLGHYFKPIVESDLPVKIIYYGIPWIGYVTSSFYNEYLARAQDSVIALVINEQETVYTSRDPWIWYYKKIEVRVLKSSD